MALLAGLHAAGRASELPRAEAPPTGRAVAAAEAASGPRPETYAQAWRSLLPNAQPAGRGRLTVWGFEVYDASLWVTPGFRHAQFDQHAFALDLAYLRAFSAREIAERSIAEMARAGTFDPAQAQRWQAALEALLPPVQRGDRLTGVHRPGRGATFLFNGKAVGEIADAEFARLFFAIWLGERSSEVALRRQLVAGTPP